MLNIVKTRIISTWSWILAWRFFFSFTFDGYLLSFFCKLIISIIFSWSRAIICSLDKVSFISSCNNRWLYSDFSQILIGFILSRTRGKRFIEFVWFQHGQTLVKSLSGAFQSSKTIFALIYIAIFHLTWLLTWLSILFLIFSKLTYVSCCLHHTSFNPRVRLILVWF